MKHQNDKLTFVRLADANVLRDADVFHDLDIWTPTDWGCALAGETGEACNIIKKLKKLSDSYKTGKISSKRFENKKKQLISSIGKELAEDQIYLDLTATALGLSLADELVKKFNETSIKYKSKITL